jgi:hypothetical protein
MRQFGHLQELYLEERRTSYREYAESRCGLNTHFLFFLALQTVLTGFASPPSSVSVSALRRSVCLS